MIEMVHILIEGFDDRTDPFQIMSVESKLVSYLAREYPQNIGVGSSLIGTKVFITLDDPTLSQSQINHIKRKVQEMAKYPYQLIILDPILQKYPLFWQIQLFELLRNDLEIRLNSLIDEEYRKSLEMQINQNFPDLPYSLLITVIDSKISQIDVRDIYNQLSQTVMNHLADYYCRGVVQASEPVIQDWDLRPFHGYHVPNWTDLRFAAKPVEFLIDRLNQSNKYRVTMYLFPARRHFLAKQLQQLGINQFYFSYRLPTEVADLVLEGDYTLESLRQLLDELEKIVIPPGETDTQYFALPQDLIDRQVQYLIDNPEIPYEVSTFLPA